MTFCPHQTWEKLLSSPTLDTTKQRYILLNSIGLQWMAVLHVELLIFCLLSTSFSPFIVPRIGHFCFCHFICYWRELLSRKQILQVKFRTSPSKSNSSVCCGGILVLNHFDLQQQFQGQLSCSPSHSHWNTFGPKDLIQFILFNFQCLRYIYEL